MFTEQTLFMVKYIVSFMIERIINNKHYGDSTLITRDKFLSEGEIVISNEVGLEGIYILNTRGEVVRIGKGGGSSESGSTEYVDAEFVRDYLRSHGYVTSAETAELITLINAINDRIDNLPTSGSGGYDQSVIDDINDRIDVLSGLTAEILSEEQVREIAAQEVSTIVSGSAEMYQILMELADWISNDSSGSAQLITEISTIKSNLSGVTERVSTAEEGITSLESDLADVAEGVITLSGSVVGHIAQNEADLQELNDKIDAIEIPEIPEPVSDEHIRDIAAQEVASLVSSADSMYQALQELAEWMENDTTGSAQLLSDVGELKDAVSANTNNINTLSAQTESLKDMIENLPTPSGSSIDESVINALKAYIDEKIAEIQVENDKVYISRSQYSELVTNGEVMIDGVMHYYSDNLYYFIYDTAPTSGDTSGNPSYDYDEETGMIEVSGETEVVDGIAEISGTVDEDGYVTISEAEPTPDEGPDIDEDDNLDLSDVTDGTPDEDGYLNLELPNNWEII